ncbi:MAG: hypothetical protein WC673_01785 [Candidatus Paceibacterota bacterium]|jgi:flagellar basal body-associated protein FliL
MEPTSTEQKTDKPVSLVVGIIVLILTVAIVIYFFTSTNVSKNPQVIMENNRTSLLARINTVNQAPLTREEKINILEKYGGAQTSQYNFTDEEKVKILKALNGK